MKIRKAKSKDLKEIAKLQNKLEKHERKFNKKQKIHTPKSLEKYLKQTVLGKRKGKIFIALNKDTNRIVGFCDGWVQKAGYLIYGKMGYVSDIYILKKYRRRGIATKLIKELKWFKSKKIKCIYLEAYSKNRPAIKTYKSLAFKEIETKFRKVI